MSIGLVLSGKPPELPKAPSLVKGMLIIGLDGKMYEWTGTTWAVAVNCPPGTIVDDRGSAR